jgi:lamin B
MQEKNTLASLNDRLAAYIERNQQLETENAQISRQLSKSEESVTRTVNRLQTSYEKELNDARRLVDETAKDKAKLVFDHNALKVDYTDAKNKLDKKIKEGAGLQKTVSQLEAQVANLTTQVNKNGSEKDKLAADNKELEGEVGRYKRELDSLRKQLEGEAMHRVDAENKLQARTDEMQFRAKDYEERIEEIRTRRHVELQEIDGKLQQEYDAKLQDTIQELRTDFEAQLRANKDESENLFEQRAADLKSQNKRIQNTLASKLEDLNASLTRVETLTTTVNKLESERNGLLDKVRELNKKMEEDQKRFAKILTDRDEEIDKLLGQKTALMTEYQELMDTKVGLDNELATYRKLLETEERRLNISPRQLLLQQQHAQGLRRTPLRGEKRKRAHFEEFSAEDSNFAYETTANVSGDVEILEDDPEGKYVKIHNKGDKEVSLSGWTLTRRAGGEETTHKFHRSVKLDVDAVLTVYSADIQGITPDASTIVMKSQKWFSGEDIYTFLINNANEEAARRETRRVQHMQSKKRLGFSTHPEDIFHQEPDGNQAERCVIC